LDGNLDRSGETKSKNKLYLIGSWLMLK